MVFLIAQDGGFGWFDEVPRHFESVALDIARVTEPFGNESRFKYFGQVGQGFFFSLRNNVKYVSRTRSEPLLLFSRSEDAHIRTRSRDCLFSDPWISTFFAYADGVETRHSCWGIPQKVERLDDHRSASISIDQTFFSGSLVSAEGFDSICTRAYYVRRCPR